LDTVQDFEDFLTLFDARVLRRVRDRRAPTP
jgi:hypothetical protein